jgi:hypothetical protein
MKHISEIIEDILVEWAYRVHDGMPNPKNAQHIHELRESMEELNLPNKVIYEVIQNLINEQDDDEEKVTFKHDGETRTITMKTARQYASDIKQGKGNDEKEAAVKAANLDSDGGSEPEKETKPPMKIDANPFDKEDDKDDKTTEEPSEEQQKKQEEKTEFLLDMVDMILQTSTEQKGEGRFNMSKDDLSKYKSYLEGNKPEIPNYDISDDDVDEVIGILKSTLGENYQKLVQRIKKKGDPPKQYSTGDAGSKRVFEVIKHYVTTGGVSTITGEYVPFSESQLDHVTSLDNGGVDGAENWEWMESRFNQFKGALSDDSVMEKIKKDLAKTPEEDKLKQLNQSFKKYYKESFIKYYGNKFKNGGNAGLTEESINNMSIADLDAVIKGWNTNNPEGSEFFVPRYGSKKDDTGKAIDRKSGRASGGRMASKPELIKRLLEKAKLAGVDIPSSSETNEVDNDLKLILDEVEKQKGEISNLKQIIKKQKAEQ